MIKNTYTYMYVYMYLYTPVECKRVGRRAMRATSLLVRRRRVGATSPRRSFNSRVSIMPCHPFRARRMACRAQNVRTWSRVWG